MPKIAHNVSDAAAPIGPYSAAVEMGGLVFFSGQVPLDATGKIAGYSMIEQARKALENLKALVAAADLTMNDIVKTTVFLAELEEFQAMNGIYAEYFQEPYPARSTVQVAELPKGVKLEIEAIAVRP
jgi:2-iminobutanoate/2-iminopropanoate deaminase